MHRHLLRHVWRLPKAALKRLVTGLLRIVLLANRPARLARSGFVLPTTVLLTLMVVLTATALTYRTFTRSDMAISQREQQVITNAATPAIDRAKAKIEFLFRRDPRFPSGVPASDLLSDLMATRINPNNEFVGYTGRISPLMGGPAQDQFSPYTLPDETRLDLNGDNILDNAWSFQSDINGNGTIEEDELIVYSILVDDQGPRTETTVRVEDPVSQAKANALVTRTGPLATTEASPACAGALAEGGWQVVTQGDNSTLQKNFQINAFVANSNEANRTFETLEFQQSRIASRASRWGAWFRYDLEVFPGAEFNWNGAMHTDGSFFANRNQFRSHMISSHNSCLYSQEASTITMAQVDLDGNDQAVPGQVVPLPDGTRQQEFQGQAVRGAIVDDNYTQHGRPIIHHWNGAGVRATTNRELTEQANNDNTHSVTGGKPSDIAMNPLRLFTNDVTEHINPGTWERRNGWDNGTFANPDTARIINDGIARPFVDDFFRADNRWGPKPRYDSRDTSLDVTRRANTTIGDPINDAAVAAKLTNPEDGLDGYWERQAIRTGLRLIVGERLQLGNAQEWGYDPRTGNVDPANESLYPPTGRPEVNDRYGRKHEYLQRRSLRDNLAAVQGMAVYHYQNAEGEGNFPAACMAMTAHPGTPTTIVNSRTFSNYEVLTNRLRTNFFTGQGTNGWEFRFPATFDTEVEFATAVGSGQPLGRALRNLAHFAGDPQGGAPSFKPVQDEGDVVHPQPFMSMWGDFSPLRRIFDDYLDNGITYANLSPADKATLHTAACTLGMLAYNIQSELDEYKALDDYTFPSSLQSITTRAGNLIQDVIAYMGGSNLTGNAGQSIMTTLNNRGIGRAGWAATCPSYTAALFSNYTEGAECGVEQYFASFLLEDWIALLPHAPGNIPGGLDAAIAELRTVATKVNRVSRLIRDRDLGFRKGTAVTSINGDFNTTVTWDPATGFTQAVGPQSASNQYRFRTLCDPNIFRSVGAGGGGGNRNVVISGLIVCSEQNIESVRYPSLYYLFPIVNHDHDGTGFHAQPGNPTEPVADQAVEDYITNPYIRAENSGYDYQVVGTDPVEGLSAIALVPGAGDLSNWVLPRTDGQTRLTTDTLPAAPFRINLPNGTTGANVAFLDKGIFDGREQLNTRVLDIDIKTLTTRRYNGGDFWLTSDPENQAEGVVYAFREDAVREDEIVRPANGSVTAAACSAISDNANNRFAIETNVDCRARYNGLYQVRLISLRI